MLIDRCPSGVPGFDALCNGGFVRNSVNAVLGGPGAGKTTFLLQYLWGGATDYDEPGLYISFEPDIIELFKDAASYGWDFQKLDSRGKCKFMKVSPQTTVGELRTELTKVITKFGVKRICFDPVGLFGSMEQNPSIIRQNMFELAALFKRLGVTVLLSDETASQDTEGGVGVFAGTVQSQFIKFLTDSVVDLYSSGLGGVSDRALRIVKMRRTKHSLGPIPMEITDSGVVVYSKKGKGF